MSLPFLLKYFENGPQFEKLQGIKIIVQIVILIVLSSYVFSSHDPLSNFGTTVFQIY